MAFSTLLCWHLAYFSDMYSGIKAGNFPLVFADAGILFWKGNARAKNL
jgi:hypothetical protein